MVLHGCVNTSLPPGSRFWGSGAGKKIDALVSFTAFGAKCRIAWRRLFGTKLLTMSDCTQLKTWINRDAKDQFAALARRQGLSESAMLKRLVLLALQKAGTGAGDKIEQTSKSLRDTRVTIRLQDTDRALLQDRAAARGILAATYVSVLTRAHLRNLAPLPKDELLTLKRTISELGRIARLLNLTARAAQQGEQMTGPGREDLRALFRVCEGLRDHVKELLRVNLASWRRGGVEASHD